MGFWANAEMFEVTDVKKYNKTMGKLSLVCSLYQRENGKLEANFLSVMGSSQL